MTARQFNNLNTRDVIKLRPKGKLRRVLKASKKEGKTFAITLRQLQCSWRGCPHEIPDMHTVYVTGDSQYMVKVRAK